MIKEIVNLGKIVNHLASVFTMKVDDKRFIRVDIDKNFEVKLNIDSVKKKEEFLEYGVFKERKGNQTILLPGSFIMEYDDKKRKIKTEIKSFENGLKKLKNEFLERILKNLTDNFDDIKDLMLSLVDKNKRNFAVCVFFDGIPVFRHNGLLAQIKEMKRGLYFKKASEGVCNILGIKDILYYPDSNFYYPFSVDKKIVLFDLRDKENLFLVSKTAIDYFFAGKEYLENFNNFQILNKKVFITVSSFNDENLKEFEKYFVNNEDSKRQYSQLISILKIASKRLKEQILINFYFYTKPIQGAEDINAYIKDVMPTFLEQIERNFETLKKEFDVIFDYESKHWIFLLNNILNEDKDKRELLKFFSKIVLGENVDIKRLMFLINRKSEKSGFYLSYYLLLIWVKGEKVKEIIGNNYEERLDYVLENFDFIKNSDSAKIGVCVGVILKMLSFSINDYDKKVLAFVSKKIGRDKKSLLKFINPIFEKAKLHQKSDKVDINIQKATFYISNLKDFDKEDFIFGLFLGDELWKYLKGEENE
jgi:hypothetical protein